MVDGDGADDDPGGGRGRREGGRETIFAVASGAGKAGVAVVRVSGPGALSAVIGLTGSLPPPRRAVVRTLRRGEDGAPIDRGLVVTFPAPSSFTGEDMAEFHLHGGRAVVAATLAGLAGLAGFRLAKPGEFARRAFDAGKLDLSEVEGLADLIDAETEAQRAQAMRQASGGLRVVVEGWRDRLVGAMALVEAAIDFSDEADVADDAVARAEADAAALMAEITAELARGHSAEIVRDGLRVVLTGPPNVGKSSLINALARRDVAIVSAEPGTTRDVLEVRLDIGGYAVVVSDTAGLRTAEGAIEAEGIRRTRQAMSAADVVVVVGAPDVAMPDARRDAIGPEHGAGGSPRLIRVRNKADLGVGTDVSGPVADTSALAVSARTGAGIDRLLAALGMHARDLAGHEEPGVVTQARQREVVSSALGELNSFVAERELPIEVRAEALRRAAAALARISGRVDVEDVLDQVFGRFCIGK
ncbi:MAG: tRNA uridine-5-carboxymethylaminomethyl(34) synthesis GTPase MnmE [Hyphomicrobiaceae bacterium]|nr:tRNA uridine-5-carboxymethylaminomethyl(34) synthesis GTPase MnmE [Hyphomicrobiaceae bacterium]